MTPLESYNDLLVLSVSRLTDCIDALLCCHLTEGETLDDKQLASLDGVAQELESIASEVTIDLMTRHAIYKETLK